MTKAAKVLGLLVMIALIAGSCGGDDDTLAETTEGRVETSSVSEDAAAPSGDTTAASDQNATPAAGGVTCAEPVTVGVITDLTGALAIYGAHITRGVPIGFAYATGGEVQVGAEQSYMLDSCEIRVVFKDDQSNSELGAAAARELIEDEGASILVGSVSSGVTATLQDIARESNVILIVAPDAATDLTGKDFDPNTFRTSRSDYQDRMAICDHFVNNLGVETFVQIAPDYSLGYVGAQAYEDACTSFGGEFLQEAVFAPAGTTDFTSYLTPIAESGAGAFLVTWAGGGLRLLLDKAIELSVINDTTALGVPFVDNIVMPAFFSEAVGTTSVVQYHYSAPGNAANDYLIDNQTSVGGTNPDLFDADGMNAAILVVEALTATGGAADADSLRAAMEGMSFEGPKGLVEIRAEDHLAIQDLYIVTLTGFDGAGPLYENVITLRPEPPCLLEGEHTTRCGDLPIGSTSS